MHVIQIFIVIGLLLVGPALAETLDSEEVQKGHRLAVTVCAICHVAAPDQRLLPELAPPAPSFASIVERKEFNADWLMHFMTTTHRGLDNPSGMPNPELMDYQIRDRCLYVELTKIMYGFFRAT